MNATNLSISENDTLTEPESSPARWPGAVMIVYSICCICPYILCLMTIAGNKDTAKSPSYQLIFNIGITDIGQLFLTGVVGGIFSLCQTDFNFYLNKVIGGTTNSLWIVYITLADLLAWNRLCHVYNQSLSERIFTLRNTRFMMAGCWLYGLAWVIAYTFPNLDLFYNVAEHNWNYGPHPSAEIFATCELVQDYFQAICMAGCYVAIVIKLVKTARQITDSQVNRDKKERIVLIQSMWICLIICTAVLLFFFNTNIIPNHWAMFFATMVWLTMAGSNAFIYLIFNQNIKSQVKEMIPCGGNKVISLQADKNGSRRNTSTLPVASDASGHSNRRLTITKQ